ncbi:uncharacterized protein LOC134176957 isoform X2 [Corticium candelabrum]|uniref:uncharacterized protein LOC134176957 isoform X2 n=1 Tax=Corticium candelabrum TaxID=121492 RepID=UPI002E274393|nr:uncharacterized protein LOC134176957 isoform X2 [Corticium candelabrum]
MVITTEYHLKIYWEYHNLTIETLLLECLIIIIYQIYCEVINDTVRLTCSFPFHLSPTASIVWNIDDTNIINKATITDLCECLITSTVFVSSQHVFASTTCTASNNNKTTIEYPYRPCAPPTSQPATSSLVTSGSIVTSTKETSKDDQPAWLILVIVVAVVALIIIIAVVAFIIWKKSKESTTTDNGTHVKLQGVVGSHHTTRPSSRSNTPRPVQPPLPTRSRRTP